MGRPWILVFLFFLTLAPALRHSWGRTAGRLVATSAFKVGCGYRLMLPVAACFTWQGTNLEGNGAPPQIEEPFSPSAVERPLPARWSGDDNQLHEQSSISTQSDLMRDLTSNGSMGAS